MTRNNWIALALIASIGAAGACSPRGGEAGQPNRELEDQDQAYQADTGRFRTDTGRDLANRDNEMNREDSDRERAAAAMVTVPAGTKLDLTINDELSSRDNKAGDTFTAKVGQDILDRSGTVLIEEGATVNGVIVAVKPAPNRRTPGTLTLALTTVETNGRTFPIRATIDSVQSEHRRQDVDAGDAGKVAVGAAAGAVVGQVLSKNTKGTVIGAVVGGITGAGVAAETKDLDIVLPDGAHILATITESFQVAVDRDGANDRNNSNRTY